MLGFMRKFTKSWFAAGLMGLLIVSFAVFGGRDAFTNRLGDYVVAAGKHTLSSADFKRMYDNWRKEAEQRSGGQPITAELVVRQGLDRRLLNEAASRESLAELFRRMGVVPSDKLVVEELRKTPGLFNPVTGQFDEKIYQQRLAENGLTPASYERLLTDDIAQQQITTAMAAGLRAPRLYGALQSAFMLEQRDLSYFDVTAAMVGQPPAPTDADIQKFMQENSARLMRPEFRVLQVVRFSPAAFEGQVTADPAAVQKKFDFRKDTLSKPETRTIVQVPAPDAKTAAAVAERLKKGEDPAAVAKSIGREAVMLNDKPKTAMPDAKVGEAAFALTQGAVSGAIQGDLGWAVVKVLRVIPGQTVTLDQIRPQLEAEVRADAAGEKVYAQTQAYDDAHSGGASLAESAAKAGVAVVTTAPVSAQGFSQDGKPVQGLTPAILKTAFDLPTGGESDVEDAGQGEYYAVRVERVVAPALPPLAEVRDQLAKIIVGQRTAERMKARADQLAERIRKGETLEAVAASAGASVKRATGLTRAAARQNQTLGGGVLQEAFAAKPGAVFTAQAAEFAYSVGKLDAVRGGDQTQMAQAAEGLRRQLTFGLFQDIGDATARYAMAKIKPRTDLERARAAIGVDPETAKAADAKAGQPAAAK